MSRVFFRSALLEANSADAKIGIARLSFASELPVLRRSRSGKFWEVLSHAPGDANIGLLNRQGVVFQDHDDEKEIGTVVRKSVRVDADKKTRAEIEIFDTTWQTRAKNCPSEIPVSVGYNRISELRQLPADKDGIITRIFSWEPYEISLLTVEPADDTVGLNRSMNKRKCADCDGSGRCRCRKSAADEADEECEHCDGDGDCPDCGGDGYFSSARKKQIDSPQISLTKEKTMTPEEIEAKRKADVAAAQTETRASTEKAERERTKNISLSADKLIEKFGKRAEGKAGEKIREYANAAIESGELAKDFSARAMEYAVTAEEPKPVRAHDIMPHETLAQFSVMRCIQSAIKDKDKGGRGIPDEKELEGEIIKTFGEELRSGSGMGAGVNPAGFIIPFDAQFGSVAMTRKDMRSAFRRMQNAYGSDFRSRRDMQANVFGAGGAVVPTYWLLPIIDLLRNKSVLNRVGMSSLAGLTGNIIIPRLEAPSTAYSLPEIAAVQASQLTLGQVSATPHRVSNFVPYSKQLVFQSSPDIEGMIHTDMMKVLALKKDALGLFGQGANDEPLGIMNTPGIGTVTFGATPTYIKMVLFETIIRQLNVMGPLAYASTSATKGSLKTVAEALTGATTIGGSQNAIWKKGIGGTGEQDGEVNGYQAVDSQQIPNNQVLCGAFENFVECMWAGIDTVIDYYTGAPNAEIKVFMHLWLDYIVRHPQAFAVSTDAGNQ